MAELQLAGADGLPLVRLLLLLYGYKFFTNFLEITNVYVRVFLQLRIRMYLPMVWFNVNSMILSQGCASLGNVQDHNIALLR